MELEPEVEAPEVLYQELPDVGLVLAPDVQEPDPPMVEVAPPEPQVVELTAVADPVAPLLAVQSPH